MGWVPCLDQHVPWRIGWALRTLWKPRSWTLMASNSCPFLAPSKFLMVSTLSGFVSSKKATSRPYSILCTVDIVLDYRHVAAVDNTTAHRRIYPKTLQPSWHTKTSGSRTPVDTARVLVAGKCLEEVKKEKKTSPFQQPGRISY